VEPKHPAAINSFRAAQAHTQSAGHNTHRSDTVADGNTKAGDIHDAAAHDGQAGNDRSSAYNDRSSSYRRYDFLTDSDHDLPLLQKVSYALRGHISVHDADPARSVGR